MRLGTSTSRSIFTLVVGCTRDTKTVLSYLHSGFREWANECWLHLAGDRSNQLVSSSSYARRRNGGTNCSGPGKPAPMTGRTLRVFLVFFLALVSLSFPCLARRLEDDEDDFTVNEATGLLESPSRRPRALVFPKDSQLLVRRKPRLRLTRLINRSRRSRSSVRDLFPFLFFPLLPFFFSLSIALQGTIRTIPPFPLVPRAVASRCGLGDMDWIGQIYFPILVQSIISSSTLDYYLERERYRRDIARDRPRLTGRFFNNSLLQRHMSEARPIFPPPCLEMVVLRITTCSA